MSNPNQINSEVARLLQILTSTASTAPAPPNPQSQLLLTSQHQPIQRPLPTPSSIPPPYPPLLQQYLQYNQQHQHQQISEWPLHSNPPLSPPYTTADPRDYRPPPPPPPHLQQQQQQQPRPPIDPSTITTWPHALRYITTTILPHTPTMQKLARMKKNQRDNEMAWHLSREELLRKHKARVEGRGRVEEILKQLNTSAAHPTIGMTETEQGQEALELHTFDLKVHKAATAMVNSMASELGQLGIPFFCGGKGGTLRLMGDGGGGGGGEGYGMEEGELRELRRKVMELVGDLVGE